MPLKKGQVMVSPSMKLILPTAKVALLALQVPPELDEGGRVGPCQEYWACENSGVDQCGNKVGHGDVPSRGGHGP
jgi:hypothetical protein